MEEDAVNGKTNGPDRTDITDDRGQKTEDGGKMTDNKKAFVGARDGFLEKSPWPPEA